MRVPTLPSGLKSCVGRGSLTQHTTARARFTRSCSANYRNNVAPGFIDTPLTNNPQAGSLLAAATQPHFTPMARAGRPEEIADVITFLLSEEASFVNGATWNVDGGFLG